MKKLFSIIFSIALLVIISSNSVLAATEIVKLDVGQVNADIGANVDVPISISNNTGICGAAITISYDERLKLINVDSGTAFSTLEMTKPGNYESNPVKILWDNVNEDKSNGVIAILTFTAPKDRGTYPITVTYEKGDIIDGDINSVEMDISNGGITVSNLKEDEEIAKDVIDKINGMDTTNKNSVEEARKNYDSLTDEQKNFVDDKVVKKLTDAESELATTADKITNTTEVKISKIKLTGISKKIAAGKKISLNVQISPKNASNQKLKWKSNNKKIATVTQKGVVTIKKNTGGKKIKITAIATDGSGKKAVWNIKVMKGAVKKIGVKEFESSLNVGKTMKLDAVIEATEGANTKLQWTTSNKKWATVSSEGVVKALKSGKGKTVKITVIATDGSNVKKVIKVKIK